MTSKTPLVAAVLQCGDDDVGYQLYSQAYGIEMQVDNEWNAEAVLLAPYDHLTSVTEDTEVTGEDAAIVSAGVTDLPISKEGIPDISAIAHPRNNWLLVGDPRKRQANEVVAKKLRAALGAGCRVIICLENTSDEQIARVHVPSSVDCSNIVIAYVSPDATKSQVAIDAAQSIRSQIKKLGAKGNPRFIVGGKISAEIAAKLVSLDGVDGVLMMDDTYYDFGTILEVLKAVGV